MRFVALTAVQGIVLATVTAAAIVVLYFLKHRRRQIVISSTQLWKRVLENRLENSLFERLRRYLSILLAVTIGLLIALAIARPEIDWLSGKARRSVIVLDTSPTMLARMKDGSSRWQHAVDAASALVDTKAGSTQVRIADTSQQFDSPFTDNRAELRRLLDRMHPVSAARRFPIVDKSEDKETQVTFVTDGVLPLAVPKGTESIFVFEETANVGITAFEIRSMPTAPLAYEGYLEAFNAGKNERIVEITVSGAGQQRVQKSVTIGAGKTHKETLDLSTFDGGGIRAALRSEGDGLSSDDVAYAYLPLKRRTKTLLVTRGNKFLENALKLDRLVDLSVVTPEGYDGGRDFDALVLDRFAPADAPSHPALIVGTPAASWLPKSGGAVKRPRFESWMETHPVMQHVSLYDVSIDSAAQIDATGSNVAILGAYQSDSPLIVASENPRWIQLAFDLQSSDFPYHPGFPVFLDNAIAWFGRERLALRRAPGTIEIPLKSAEVRTIDGRSVPTQDSVNGTLFEADDPGLYVASSGDSRQYVAVNFASHDFSNINNSRALEDLLVKRAGVRVFRHELWIYMLALAALLVAAEWFTYHRRITV
jgi:hypothetical protein